MTQPADLALLAGKLTKAQRRVILAMDSGYKYASQIPAHGATLRALWDFGRCYDTTEQAVAPPVMLVTQDVSDFPLGYIWALTDLGLALRAHLTENSNG